MLLEFPGTITINGSQVIENLRLHVPNSSQFRCKFIANGDEKIPVDIICTSINYQANLNGVKVILSGMENTKRLNYRISLTIHPIAKSSDVSGYIGTMDIHKTLKNTGGAIEIFKEICMLFTTN